jgi:TrmH family RNA methyltransferase
MITSLNNDRVKRVCQLQSRRRAREKSGLFVIEGTKLARDAFEAGMPIAEVFYTFSYAESEEGQALLSELSTQSAALTIVDDAVMQAMSDTETPQGLLLTLPIPALESPSGTPFILIVSGVADPGNMGTIMRAAAAAGVPQMLVTSGTVDVTNPKVVRSAMGAHFRLPVQHLSWDSIADRLDEHVIFLAESGSGTPYFDVNWRQPCALIIGSEARGPGTRARQIAHAYVTIPMPGGMESLNVAMATSILLFEMVRQRTTGG